jgi:hypothetical protein
MIKHRLNKLEANVTTKYAPKEPTVIVYHWMPDSDIRLTKDEEIEFLEWSKNEALIKNPKASAVMIDYTKESIDLWRAQK